jgi:hypothetical protein
MKRLIILAFIALACAPRQEVRYTRPDWPTPEEVRRDLGIDPIKAFTFDSTLAFEPLDSTEVATLEAARWVYYQAVKDSFPDMGNWWWSTSVQSWMSSACDSLIAIEHSPGIWIDLVNWRAWHIWHEAYKRALESSNHPVDSPEFIKQEKIIEQLLDTLNSLPYLSSYLPWR